ncbi:hypothetical protein A4H97_04650 [Niastella yeongjuensis]|uniref:Lipoprotein n=1 Tax=Niastella yeongjuensis TaxID=354355 RepID=A0A1V9EKZ0_9BACT|nr:hypothetical protein [Niastella yeongjuensis]OQP46817.1 hypothetical protein A4H97_04650 [Niastella yeongjuensis]SEN55554.1 hypothetical protein SAMN05660816_00953 [Niastella yeongjuensis]
MSMRQISIFALLFLSACSTSKKITPGICDEYFKSVKSHTIKGTKHCRSILIANGVVIRTEEVNASLLRHVDVIKCPDAYKTYGDIGTNGVIVEETKQTFDFIIPSQVDYKRKSDYLNKNKTYFLNGYLITNDSLRISKKAIVRTEVLTAKSYSNGFDNDSIVIINIWTLTKKEVRKSLRKWSRSYD